VSFLHLDSGYALTVAFIVVAAFVSGFFVSMIIYGAGKRKKANYDWRVLWLSVSIIVLVAQVLFRALRRF
jgi:hypothetical protein